MRLKPVDLPAQRDLVQENFLIETRDELMPVFVEVSFRALRERALNDGLAANIDTADLLDTYIIRILDLAEENYADKKYADEGKYRIVRVTNGDLCRNG